MLRNGRRYAAMLEASAIMKWCYVGSISDNEMSSLSALVLFSEMGSEIRKCRAAIRSYLLYVIGRIRGN